MTEAAARSTTVDRAEQPPRSQWYDVWDQFKSHKGALVGAAVFGAILLFISRFLNLESFPFQQWLDPVQQWLDLAPRDLFQVQ